VRGAVAEPVVDAADAVVVDAEAGRVPAVAVALLADKAAPAERGAVRAVHAVVDVVTARDVTVKAGAATVEASSSRT